MCQKILLTQEGHTKLISELAEMKAKRDHLITQIEDVAQPDESGEDNLSVQLKGELEVVNEKIDAIEETLENCQIINGSRVGETVQLGSKVKIKISGSLEKIFHIVSRMEADPTSNKISDESPLGRALLGKKLHEEVEVEAPVGRISYKIVSIA